jgi:RNA polymerase sigma-70 factor (ECF subfamily)
LALVRGEREIADRIRAGDPAALEAVFLAWYEPLYRYAYSLVGTREAAEEAVQDVFCGVWARHATLPVAGAGTTLRAYFYGAVRNRAGNQLRHEHVVRAGDNGAVRDERGEGSGPIPGMGVPPRAADSVMLAAERAEAVRAALSALPARHREVLALRADHGLTYPEIALALGISVKTVEAHVRRAFRTLRRRLAHLAT